jgi:autotransporter adhesin
MAAAACAATATTNSGAANAAPPTPSTLVSVCSGVSLPPSAVTGIIDPVLTGIYGPIETNTNQTLSILNGLLIPGLPAPLSVDVNGLLTTAASGSDISLSVLAQDGTLVGPSSQCDATADSFTLDTPAGISIGGNQITGLGDPNQVAVAGEIDSVAIGNRASTDPTAIGAIAIGPDANVGLNAIGSIAIGSNASATGVNSVALGAGSAATRDNSVSIGSRQLTDVAAGTQLTDAVNLGQLNAVAAAIPTDAVQYDDPSHNVITLDGAGGTLITNVQAGAVNATSTDAINGSQLFAVQTQVDGIQTQVTTNTNAITNLQTTVGGNSTAITNLQTQVNNNTTSVTNLTLAVQNGAVGPVQYSDPGTPTTPNGGTPSNDVTLVGGAPGPVAVHNVADGVIAAGSTDAINGGQIFNLALGVADAVVYDDASHSSVTFNPGNGPASVHNVANGVAATDAVNVSQLNSAASNAVTIANNYTDMRLADLNFDLNRVGKDARSGTAAALAAAGMPQAMDAGRPMIAGGFGTYRGKVGFAFGASYRAENGKSVYKLGITYDSSDHVGANAGAGFQF